MDIDPAEVTRWIAGDVEDEEDDGNDETADIYTEYLELSEVEERLLHRPRLPQLPPNPRRRRIDFAVLQGQLNQILKGVCVTGRFSVQTSNERSDGTVARATVVVERGPSELLNHMVRVYSLKDRNRARQGDQVWVELRSCALDRAALERRSRSEGDWNLAEALRYACLFGAVLRSETPSCPAAQRSYYLCKQSQMQWKPGVLNFIPFSHEVPILQVHGERLQPLEDVFKLLVVDWPVNRLRPIAEIVEKVSVPRALEADGCLRLFLKDLEFLEAADATEEEETAKALVEEAKVSLEEEDERCEMDGHIFSIDSAGADMIDDALEYDIESEVVRVHLADVAALVRSQGDLDLWAAKKACSIYFKDYNGEVKGYHPMLPRCVTAETSLDRGRWRRALTFEFEITTGAPRCRKFFRSWVRSKEQWNFSEAEELMTEGGGEGRGVCRSLRKLWPWTRAVIERKKVDGNLQAFTSAANCEGNAEALVEFWMTQVNEESGRIISNRGLGVSYCHPCPDAHHFSKLAVLCREALLRAGPVAHDGLLLNLRSSPEGCQEGLSEILQHVQRLNAEAGPTPGGAPTNRWSRNRTTTSAPGSAARGRQAVAVLCQQLSQCVPVGYYRASNSSAPQWPVMQRKHYFQVTSPMRRWIDLLGQHLLLDTCELDEEEMAEYVGSFNEMSLVARQASSRFAFLSFCIELQKSERQMECVVSRIDQGTLHLSCPDIAGFHRPPLMLPLGLLSSHDLAVRPIVEEKKAIITRVADAQQLELRPFHSKLLVQLSLDISSPVCLYRLSASALYFDFRDGQLFRHAILPRQHPEVFGPVPDLRKARNMHKEGGLWGSTWYQVRSAQLCAAALMPQMRAKAPYFMTASYKEVSNFTFVAGTDVYVTVPSNYRGLQGFGLRKLEVGHLCILWRRQGNHFWMSCGHVKDVEVNEQMKRKTILCRRFMNDGTCEFEDCWYAHGSEDLLEERAKVNIELSECSQRCLPAWVTSSNGTLDLDFAVISKREQLALKNVKEVERTSERQPQQLVNRLVFRRGGGWPRPPAIEDEPELGTPAGLQELNHYQYKALQLTLKEVLAYVQGPPGTGKSTTAAHLICHLLIRADPSQAKPLLVCCPSNKACDRLLRLFLMAEMSQQKKIVRVYAKSIEQNHWRDPRAPFCRDYEIDPDLLQYALHQQVELDDPELKKQYLDTASKLQDCPKPGQLIALHETMDEMRKRKESASKDILKQAEVIFTTCDCACNDRLFNKMTFPSVIIDEAAQALEPELARCCLLAEGHLALFGDHEQLGPVLTEQSLFPAFKNMWTQSLFERLVSRRGRGGSGGGIPHVTLKRQYRMHPSISCFANAEFYNFQLLDDPEANREGLTLPSDFNSRLSVVEVTGPHGRKSVTPEGDAVQDFETSLCNPSEALVVKAYVQWLMRFNVDPSEIAVVTPYRAQAALIKELLAEVVMESGSPTIGTVHLLQGEERQYVILSLVRSFAEADTEVFDPVPQNMRRKVYNLGFLNDRRLANVALTRAQLGLVVVANTQVLSNASHWKNLFHHAQENGSYWQEEDAMDFFQRSDSDAWLHASPDDSYWGSQELPSGSESEGHEEAASEDVASEASAFASAPPSSDEEMEAPPTLAVTPPQRSRRRKKKAKAKAKAKAAPSPPEGDELLQEVQVAPSTSSSAELMQCVVDCRNRPHKTSTFASTYGLCATHWKELLKETNVLDSMEGPDLPASLIERFIMPAYWGLPAPPIVVEKGLRSRPFFKLLLCYLQSREKKSSLRELFVVAFKELVCLAQISLCSADQLVQRLVARHGAMPFVLPSVPEVVSLGLILMILALADCLEEVPPQLQERWQLIEAACSFGEVVPAETTQIQVAHVAFQQDMISIATFWKDQGNQLKRQNDFNLAIATYLKGTDLLQELPLTLEVAQVTADLFNNAAAVAIDVEHFPDAEKFAGHALEYLSHLAEPDATKKSKALYRRGVALHRLGRLQEAVEDLTLALQNSPSDEQIGARMELQRQQQQEDR